VFVINLENKGYDETFGPGSAAPYLSRTLRGKGNLLTQYYGTAHLSLPNYIGQISGQGPDSQTQSDCQNYSDFVGSGAATVPPQQVVGNGCVYPKSVRTLPNQLAGKGLTWHGYLEDMGNNPAQPATCRHPAIGSQDDTQHARPGDQYAVRHNPFVYFHSIIDTPACAANDVPLDRLTGDLATVATTPNYSMIVPNLCHDGHDQPCVNGEPGGLVSADAFLKSWVPKILASPAYQRDGLLIVTFDESDGPEADSSACCNEGPGPNSPVPGISGPGGGRVGAVAVSRYIKPGSLNDTPYNHYALLGSIEDLFALPHLGYAQQVPYRFGRDVYTNY
ncbi:MAG: alkaline phosphatase family protein, partial [Mycobacteriales bacterium]